MQEGHTYLQKGDFQTAYTAFLDALDATDPSDIITLAQAKQMLGVCARLKGDLDEAEARLTSALKLGQTDQLGAILAGTISRDLGAVYTALYRIYRTRFSGHARSTTRQYRSAAAFHYAMSEQLLSESDVPAIIERYVTKGFQLQLEWFVADELPENKRQTEKTRISYELESQYRSVRHRYSLDACLLRTNPHKATHQVYVADMLIRVLRTEALLQRLTHWRELLELTGPDSPSAGSRRRGMVALIFGERVYSWFELRTARQSR